MIYIFKNEQHRKYCQIEQRRYSSQVWIGYLTVTHTQSVLLFRLFIWSFVHTWTILCIECIRKRNTNKNNRFKVPLFYWCHCCCCCCRCCFHHYFIVLVSFFGRSRMICRPTKTENTRSTIASLLIETKCLQLYYMEFYREKEWRVHCALLGIYFVALVWKCHTKRIRMQMHCTMY